MTLYELKNIFPYSTNFFLEKEPVLLYIADASTTSKAIFMSCHQDLNEFQAKLKAMSMNDIASYSTYLEEAKNSKFLLDSYLEEVCGDLGFTFDYNSFRVLRAEVFNFISDEDIKVWLERT